MPNEARRGEVPMAQSEESHKEVQRYVQALGLNHFDSLLDLSEDAVLIAECESTRILKVNQRTRDLLGISEERLTEMSLKDITPGAFSRKIAELRLPPHGEVSDKFTVRTTLLADAGKKVRARVTCRLARSGESIYVIAIAEKVALDKSADEQAQKSQRIYQLLTNNLVGFTWSMGRKFDLTHISPSVEAVLQFEARELLNSDLRELVATTSREAAIRVFERIKKVKKGDRHQLDVVLTQELEMIRKDGSSTWVEMNLAAFRSQKGMASGYAGFCKDISEQKKAEEARREVESKFQRTQRLESLGILAGGIAHDFNNLLTGIYGYSSLALRNLDKDSPAREKIIKIGNIGRRAGELTRQLLAYSGKGSVVIERLSLNQVAEDIKELLKVSYSKKVTFQKELADDLPLIRGDVAQIQQVVLNLITNASDAIGDHEGRIVLRSGVDRVENGRFVDADFETELPEGRYSYVQVSDNGCGMDKDTQERLFEPFFTTKLKGRGLGLAAVSGIVRGHRGALKLESTLGEGTVMTVLLPCYGGSEELDKLNSSPESRSDSDWHGSGTVLVVDDEEHIREIAESILENAGFSVVSAVDGLDAIELFRERNGEFSAILLDFSMPQMNGEETFLELRRMRDGIPIVISSGYMKEEVVERLLGTNSATFLQKPYRTTELLSALREVLET